MRVLLRSAVVRDGCRLLLAALLVPLAGCQTLANARLLAPPAWVGLKEAAVDVRIEQGASAAQQEAILQLREAARQRVRAAVGEPRSRPVQVFCVTAACYQGFGGGSPRAKAFGASRLLIGPDALTAAYVAHEWWHAELFQRVGWWRYGQVPRWFDEGVAVWISGDPRYGDAMYQRVLAEGIQPPTLNDLRTTDGFNAAIGRHGDHLWASKPADAVTVVYPTAAHEVSRWMAIVGKAGLDDMVAGLARGDDFDSLYRAIEQGRRAPP